MLTWQATFLPICAFVFTPLFKTRIWILFKNRCKLSNGCLIQDIGVSLVIYSPLYFGCCIFFLQNVTCPFQSPLTAFPSWYWCHLSALYCGVSHPILLVYVFCVSDSLLLSKRRYATWCSCSAGSVQPVWHWQVERVWQHRVIILHVCMNQNGEHVGHPIIPCKWYIV
jgi:hypothetical protein